MGREKEDDIQDMDTRKGLILIYPKDSTTAQLHSVRLFNSWMLLVVENSHDGNEALLQSEGDSYENVIHRARYFREF